MGQYLVQGGDTLKFMSTSGTLTSLTLPTGITLDSSKRMRAVAFGSLVVVVNSPSAPITVDRFGTCRLLCPNPPSSPVSLTTAASGTLSGTFRVKPTYVVFDEFGNLIAESEFGPASAASATLASQYLVANSVAVSPQTISARRLYRTATGPGTSYFQWADVGGNLVTSYQDDLSDAALGLLAAPTDLGTPPQLDMIVSWKNRLWGRSPNSIDTLWQSGNGKAYAWPHNRIIPIPPTNFDNRGITGLLPRRDELGIGKVNSIHKISGTSESNFTRTVVTDGIGVWAPDSCCSIFDVAFFLGNPFGIYTWSVNGVKNISNENVKGWFETDTYFNRARFDQAVGWYDPTYNAYVLLLSAPGSTDLDRWIMYDIANETWWGPHKTGAFTPTGGCTLRDANDIPISVILASDGKLYKPQSTKTDGSSTAIDYDVITNWLSVDSPGIMKYWGEPDIETKILAAGTMTVTPTLGKTDASAGTAISHNMTLGRERLPRLGIGELLKLEFRHNTAGQNTVLYGIELPVHELGRR